MPSASKTKPRSAKTKTASAKLERKATKVIKVLKVLKVLKVRKAAKAAKKPASAGGKSRAPSPALRERAQDIETRLSAAIAEPRCELNHSSAWELLIATILSAQSTDRMVNRVTPSLFKRYPTPAALSDADQDELEALIKSTGFFRNKAKSIRAASRQIVEQFGGEVPRTLDEITQLSGVARKTGNVVLGTAYRIPSGIMVDTHAGRVSRRLQLTKHDDPVKVEHDLCALFPESSWVDMGHRFVLHGRYTCLARSPNCVQCPLNELCKSREAKPAAGWQARAKLEGDRVAAGFGTT